MKSLFSLMLALCMLFSLPGVYAETVDAEATVSATVATEEEALSVTHHTAEVAGQTLGYTATVGRLPVSMGDQKCQMFFTAYTLDGVEDMTQRPITFAFNGGPGSSSEWLHLGMLAPRRVETDQDGQPTQLPVKIVDNPFSILDMTDLVFIDPVGTGYSRAAEGSDPRAFYSYSGDIISVSEFIRLYATRNGRWGSPKYLAGESYGTARAVGVANYLADAYAMGLNGLMLISSANDYSVLMMEDRMNELPYALYLPTYAAIGQYHGLLEEPYQSMPVEELIAEVREFAATEYQAALFRGSALDEARKEAVAEKVAAYTGLAKDYVLKHNLRVFLDDFCADLLADRKLMVGRIDARYTGPLTEGDIGSSNADPSSAILGSVFGMAINQYLGDELDYHSDLTYKTLSNDINIAWDFGRDNYVLSQREDIYNAMSRNRFMKVWVLCGYYDLATPFGAAEWLFDHIFLNPETRPNLSFTYYPSGHMIYMHEPSLAQFRQDAVTWYLGD